jgi:hypothetical protein
MTPPEDDTLLLGDAPNPLNASEMLQILRAADILFQGTPKGNFPHSGYPWVIPDGFKRKRD